MDEPQQVLVGVPEPHAPPDARLEHGRGARQVEGDHALVGVPGVDHPVDVRIAGRHLDGREPLRPHRPQGPRSWSTCPPAGTARSPPAPATCPAGASREGRTCRPPGSRCTRGRTSRRATPRVEHERRLEGPDRLPAVGDRAAHRAALHGPGSVPASVWPEERLARRLEPGHRPGAGEPGEVVAALAVLGQVVDDAVLDVDLAGGQVALEVGGIVLGVPQAELDRAEQRQPGRRPAARWSPAPASTSTVSPGGTRYQRLGADPASLAVDDGVPRGRGGRRSCRARAASAASPGSSRRPCRRRGRRGSGHRRQAGRCCSGTGSAAAAGRRGRTSSRPRCWRRARSTPRCRGS